MFYPGIDDPKAVKKIVRELADVAYVDARIGQNQVLVVTVLITNPLLCNLFKKMSGVNVKVQRYLRSAHNFRFPELQMVAQVYFAVLWSRSRELRSQN